MYLISLISSIISLRAEFIGNGGVSLFCLVKKLFDQNRVTSVDISEDSSLLAAGFADGNIRVWSLTSNKLREMKDPDDLDLIDKEAGMGFLWGRILDFSLTILVTMNNYPFTLQKSQVFVSYRTGFSHQTQDKNKQETCRAVILL